MSRKKTAKENTLKLVEWIRTTYSGKPSVNRTSETIAALASKSLGFYVSANRMCRELRREGISFKASADDPRPQNYSKVDLLRARVDMMESRLAKLEGVKA